MFFGRIANFINGELWGRPTDGSWGVVFPRAPVGPEGHHVPRHPSQLYEAVLEGPLLFGLLLWIRMNYDRTGRTSVLFLVGYAVMRFFVEFFRAPDPHLGYELLGLTRGQWYSVLFVLVGVGIWLFIRRFPRLLE
jgi:phosphatidylglycerol:prolipoprotein diacylglycerol transferase